jgi:hypothetical protein
MNVAFLSIALASQLGNPLVIRVGDRVPVINVEQTCKKAAATDKAANLALPQSVEKCMRDENAAREQLATVWATYSVQVRNRCEQEATLVGTGSYVELLICMQMTDPATMSPTPALRGRARIETRTSAKRPAWRDQGGTPIRRPGHRRALCLPLPRRGPRRQRNDGRDRGRCLRRLRRAASSCIPMQLEHSQGHRLRRASIL